MSGDSADGPFSSRDDMSDFIDWESELGVSSESIDDEIKGTDEVKVLARLHKTDEEIALLTLDESLDEVKRALHLLRYAAGPDPGGPLRASPAAQRTAQGNTHPSAAAVSGGRTPSLTARYGYSDLATQQETLPARPPDLQIMAASVLYDLVDKGQLPEAAVDDVYQCAARLLNSKDEDISAVWGDVFIVSIKFMSQKSVYEFVGAPMHR
ncbi:hypothetical protein HDU82_000277, partial [Entophlyctis luteolus]